jgi:spore maturation protein CgeB
MSYLGTHSSDRLRALETLFLEPARRLPQERFLIGGAKYDGTFPWLPNIFFVHHVRSVDHPAFFSSGKFTLNVTRRAMAINGFCPSGRLFEAAACGAVIISDAWEGLETFFEPDSEILVAESSDDVLAAMTKSPDELRKIGNAARERALSCHTADLRARELENILTTSAASVETGA